MIYLKDATGPGFTPVSSTNPVPVNFGARTLTGTGTETALSLSYTVNMSDGGAATGLKINATQTAVGSGAQLLADFQVGGTSQVSIDNGGKLTFKSGTTSAVGLQFGTDVNLYRSANNSVTLSSGGNSQFNWLSSGADRALAQWSGGVFELTTVGSNTLVLKTGNTTALTLGTSQQATFAGALITTPQALSGAGAVDVVTTTTDYTSTGDAQALTLANGTSGQIKIIKHVVDGGSGVLTPTTASGFSTITFTNAGETATLQYGSAGWCILSLRGAVAA